MDKQWTELFEKEIEAFQDKIEAFDKGELNRAEYKGISGGFGSYAQRNGAEHMLRLRLPGGRLPLERLGFLMKLVEQEQVKRIKLTTCETLQLHDLAADQVPKMIREASEHGIFTKGGGGDNPRNVMASPLSGVEPGEAFDVMPWAEAVSEYLLSICREIKMPRKLKIAFCNGVDDRVHSAFRDMGFQAQPDGTFSLRIAGGLGAFDPRMGLLVAEQIKPEEVLYYVRAMIDVFCTYGNYEKRPKARTRFLQETLGPEGLKNVFEKRVEELLQQGALTLESGKRSPVTKTGDGVINHPRVLPQKQPGLYSVSYHPVGGLLLPDRLRQMYECLKEMTDIEVRVSPDETLYVINLTAGEAEKLLTVTDDGAETEFERSVSCIGAATCQQGIRDSQGLLRKLVNAVREAKIPDGALPRICISGCPSSCAFHQAGAIGLKGGVKLVDKTPMPAFKLSLGGKDKLGEARFGDEIAVILEEELPAFFVELGRAAEEEGQNWEQWSKEHPEKLNEIIGRYA